MGTFGVGTVVVGGWCAGGAAGGNRWLGWDGGLDDGDMTVLTLFSAFVVTADRAVRQQMGACATAGVRQRS